MIKVLLFAHLQEKIGKDQLELEIIQSTVAELKNKLKNQFQLYELNSVMTAINEEYAMDEDIVKSGDTVAFIPPVSGG
ncbi:molybdopterin converting factor subunit 1 [Oceanobacillus halophilus]|uniref:Molybdopterin synthase sulfur carrier subunit n=1 Tax=Oceanobacillus halophilus TaxID=930130 RepID=A0A495AC75_9BACI|nr:molybdopterin converting factor subunit 1 [Oceanobacillus halophilus]RKQ37240.1 molybdopterin converting factor subunit 1 [Oceanobacillus halophilus]